jgi:hypothetical protein
MPQQHGFDPGSERVGSAVDKVVALGQVFSEYLGFPLPILIPPNIPYLSIIRTSYNRTIISRHTEWTLPHLPKKMTTKLVTKTVYHNAQLRYWYAVLTEEVSLNNIWNT